MSNQFENKYLKHCKKRGRRPHPSTQLILSSADTKIAKLKAENAELKAATGVSQQDYNKMKRIVETAAIQEMLDSILGSSEYTHADGLISDIYEYLELKGMNGDTYI